jgi:hypothetical protein
MRYQTSSGAAKSNASFTCEKATSVTALWTAKSRGSSNVSLFQKAYSKLISASPAHVQIQAEFTFYQTSGGGIIRSRFGKFPSQCTPSVPLRTHAPHPLLSLPSQEEAMPSVGLGIRLLQHINLCSHHMQFSRRERR